MGLLIFSYRKQDIIRRKLDLELKLDRLTQKLFDLSSYGQAISDGSVSINDLMHVPSSLFGRMTTFMMYSHQQAYAGAQQNYSLAMATPGAMPQMPNAQLQQQYQQMLFKSYYDNQRQEFKKVEENALNEDEKKITADKEKIQTQLKMLEAELTSVKEGEDKAAKDSAPKYA